MVRIIPASNDWIGMFVSEDTETGSVEGIKSSALWWLPKPTRGQYAQKVSARKDQYVPVLILNLADHPVGSSLHVGWRFSVGTTITEELPVRVLPLDIHRPKTFIVSVVPFHKVVAGFYAITKASNLTGAFGPLQRTAKDHLKIDPS